VTVNLEKTAEFLFAYARRYRDAYARATAAPPHGSGYPKLLASPYLRASHLHVYVAADGVVVNEVEREPEYAWYVAGGPALKVDLEPTRTPPEVFDALKENDLLGKPIGIYRIVAQGHIPASIWRGRIRGIAREIKLRDDQTSITLTFHDIRSSLKDLVSSLSFGAYGIVLDIRLPTSDSQIGEPHLIRNFGVFPADLNNRRFFSHLEIHGQADEGAWDTRIVNLRVQQDIRRDLSAALSKPGESGGGSISLGSGNTWIEDYTNRLERLRSAIADLRAALLTKGEDVEAVFHDVLQRHPLGNLCTAGRECRA